MPIRLDQAQIFVADRGVLSVAEMYHENTKVRPFDNHWSDEMFSPGGLKAVYQQVKDPYKTYAGSKSVKLSAAPRFSTLARIIKKRRSVREFRQTPTDPRTLGRILGIACGVTGEHRLAGGDKLLLRAAPSGGGLYPIEVYPIVLNGKGLDAGIYHYHPRDHSLELIKTGCFRNKIKNIALRQPLLDAANVVFVMTAISARNMFKYADRGYRYMLLDAGHMAQNLYLASGEAGLGGCTIGGFVDDELNHLLEIDGVNEFSLYLFVLGLPARPTIAQKCAAMMRVVWRRLAQGMYRARRR